MSFLQGSQASRWDASAFATNPAINCRATFGHSYGMIPGDGEELCRSRLGLGRGDCPVRLMVGMASEYPKLSGGLDAYEFYIETVLQWLCHDCGEYVQCTNDIRENEQEAPYGDWATRKGKEAMIAGWYVRPLSENGSLTSIECLCPKCAKNHGLVISKS
jgi:hypothetical protein